MNNQQELASWQRFASYCRCCAQSGEHDPMTYEQFIEHELSPPAPPQYGKFSVGRIYNLCEGGEPVGEPQIIISEREPLDPKRLPKRLCNFTNNYPIDTLIEWARMICDTLNKSHGYDVIVNKQDSQ